VPPASDDGRPILERLGFIPVATTTPNTWSPPEDTSDVAEVSAG